ncbi:MAG: hypothetical protein QOF60_3263 [Actinomycetota bacterium]|nr:hypothetical protein [Actinomycetota bacterium]
MAQAMTTTAAPAPERQLATDMVRRGLPALPVLVIVAALGWGVHGALSSAYAIVLVIVNLLLSAAALAWAARISPPAIMATAMGGFLVRMALIVLAVQAVKGQAWVEVVPLGITIVVTHLGLLIMESRHVSASLAYPALKPPRTGA